MKNQTFSKQFFRSILRWGVLLAPIPTAAIVYRVGVEDLGWYVFAAIAAAVYLEILGISTAELAASMHSYNIGRTEKRAPAGLAISTALFYLASVISIIFVIEIAPEYSGWTAAIVPVAGMVGYFTRALGEEQESREKVAVDVENHQTEVEYQREQMALEAEQQRIAIALEIEKATQFQAIEQKRLDSELRRELKLKKLENVSLTSALTKSDTPTKTDISPSVRRQKLIDQLSTGEKLDIGKFARENGISRPSVYNDLAILQQAGEVKSNGRGWRAVQNGS